MLGSGQVRSVLLGEALEVLALPQEDGEPRATTAELLHRVRPADPGAEPGRADEGQPPELRQHLLRPRPHSVRVQVVCADQGQVAESLQLLE